MKIYNKGTNFSYHKEIHISERIGDYMWLGKTFCDNKEFALRIAR